jgi:trimeric autotransporter adhesin
LDILPKHRFLFLALFAGGGLYAQSGFVKSANQPIPGATVTATIGGRQVVTVTDQSGRYAFSAAPAGDCSIEVRMFGFDPATKKLNCAEAAKIDFALQLQESPLAQRMARMGGAQAGGNQLEAQLQTEMTAPEAAAPGAAPVDGQNSSEAFQVSGSLSQGMAQNAQPDFGMMMGGMGGPGGPGGGQYGGPGGPGGGGPGGGFGGPGGGGFGGPGGGGFGGPGGRGGAPGGNRGQAQGRPGGAQFGNRRAPSQIHGMAFMTLANSAVNARPFSITGQEVPEPSYASSRFGFLVGGPLVIPKIVKDTATFFYLNYTGTRSRQSYTATETVPTALERGGDFSQTLAANNTPVQIVNPTTGTPFPGNKIPSGMLNPIAVRLLDDYIPLPNQSGTVNNYQYLASPPNNTDNLNGRVMRSLNQKDRLAYHLSYQRRDGDNAQPFAFFDTIGGYGIQTDLTWTHNFTPATILSSMVSFNRNRNETTPFFANGANVAAELGIAGTSSNPVDFGPPNLYFTNFGPLSDGNPVLTRNQSQGLTESVILSRGKHTVTLGGQYSRNDTSSITQQNGRGTFNFTGEASGFDFADFLLDLPQSASIQYSPAMYFTQNTWGGYALDDWKVSANLTVNLGLRYEIFAPLQEKYGDMANLEVSGAGVTPFGPSSGMYSAGLINPDYRNFSPRVGLSWKAPFIKRSTIVRAGYGIYYNGQSYIPFGLKLAQQPPFAVSQSVNTSAANPLDLQTGLEPPPSAPGAPIVYTNTFAVNPYYRAPYAQTWNVTIQHDLGRGFFMELGYLGTKGTRLDVLTLPGEDSPILPPSGHQLGNATGFTYDAPIGDSSFNALQTHLMRRFRGGISMNARYTFSKSIDDASSFGGVGSTVAQNWLDLAAERGLSSFNRTNVFNVSWVYTSPFGNPNSRFASSGWSGRLLRNWSLSGSVTAESGTPLTACVLGKEAGALAQTGGTCSLRADATGEPVTDGSGFFNKAAFTLPPPGQFGDAGRNTIPGPNLVSVNAAFGRSFQFGDTRRRLEFRAEANNVLNQVSYTNVATVVNSVTYGLPTAASAMRTMDIVMRFRF